MSKLRIPPELGNVHSPVSTWWTAAWQRTPIPRLRNGYFKASVRMRTDVISLPAAVRVRVVDIAVSTADKVSARAFPQVQPSHQLVSVARRRLRSLTAVIC